MVNIMHIREGNVLRLRKKHVCGSDKWLVLRTGVGFRLKCVGCQHEILMERQKLEYKIKGNINTKD